MSLFNSVRFFFSQLFYVVLYHFSWIWRSTLPFSCGPLLPRGCYSSPQIYYRFRFPPSYYCTGRFSVFARSPGWPSDTDLSSVSRILCCCCKRFFFISISGVVSRMASGYPSADGTLSRGFGDGDQRLKMFPRYIMFSLPVAIAPYWQLCFSIILKKEGLREITDIERSHAFMSMRNYFFSYAKLGLFQFPIIPLMFWKGV